MAHWIQIFFLFVIHFLLNIQLYEFLQHDAMLYTDAGNGTGSAKMLGCFRVSRINSTRDIRAYLNIILQ